MHNKPKWADEVLEVSEEEAKILFKAGVDVGADYGFGDILFDTSWRSHHRERMRIIMENPDVYYLYHKFFYILKEEESV